MHYPISQLYLQGHRRLLQRFPSVWSCSEERFIQAVTAVKVRPSPFSRSNGVATEIPALHPAA